MKKIKKLTLKCVQVQKRQLVVGQPDLLQFPSLFECVWFDFLNILTPSAKNFQIWEFCEDRWYWMEPRIFQSKGESLTTIETNSLHKKGRTNLDHFLFKLVFPLFWFLLITFLIYSVEYINHSCKLWIFSRGHGFFEKSPWLRFVRPFLCNEFVSIVKGAILSIGRSVVRFSIESNSTQFKPFHIL